MTATAHVYTGGGGGTTIPDVNPTRGAATSVPPNAETTVVSHAVPGGFTYKLHGIVATGNAPAEWVLYDDAVEVFRFRTSPADRGTPRLWMNGLPFAATHTVALKVVHLEGDTIGGSTSRSFYATLLGRDA
jgi:hypothetical protein